MSTIALMWALKQNYHADKMNAAVHMASVKFSPITFALFEALLDQHIQVADDPMLLELEAHHGIYELDAGR